MASSRSTCLILALLVALPVLGQGTPAGDLPVQQLPWLRRRPAKPVVFPPLLVDAQAAAAGLAAGWRALDLRPDVVRAERPAAGAVAMSADFGCRQADRACVAEALAHQGLSGGTVLLLSEHGAPEEVAGAFMRLAQLTSFDVRILAGGFAGGFAVASDGRPAATAGPAAAGDPARPASPLVDAGWLGTRFGSEEVEILDLRSTAAWEGRAPIAPPAEALVARAPHGHVPHSLPFDPAALLVASGFPEVSAARRILSAVGPRRGTYVNMEATFVLVGETAEDPRLALGYLLLHWMGVDTRVLSGGIAAWAADPHRPLVEVVEPRQVASLLAAENPGLEADQRPQSLVILDVRTEPDFAAAHLPGALNLPAHLCREQIVATIDAAVPGAAADTPLVVYCYGTTCIRSRECLSWAGRGGFTRLLWLREGMPGWREAGLPVFKAPGGGSTYPLPRPSAEPRGLH